MDLTDTYIIKKFIGFLAAHNVLPQYCYFFIKDRGKNIIAADILNFLRKTDPSSFIDSAFGWVFDPNTNWYSIHRQWLKRLQSLTIEKTTQKNDFILP